MSLCNNLADLQVGLVMLLKPDAHRLKGELIVASRIVHPEIKCQTSNHCGGDAVGIIK
jgi:hypothetical protein